MILTGLASAPGTARRPAVRVDCGQHAAGLLAHRCGPDRRDHRDLPLAEMPVLLAIPLFTFAGYLLPNHARRSAWCASPMPCSAGCPAVWRRSCWWCVRCLPAFTGASGITIVALAPALSGLKQAGYPERFNLGLITPREASACCSRRHCR